MTAIQELGVEVIQYLQSFHPDLDAIMGFLALFVKIEYFLVFMLPVIYWNFGHRYFITLLIAVLVDVQLGEILRILLAQPRPWWIADIVPIDAVTSIYSSPAGYSSYMVVFLGYISYSYKKKWFTITSIIIITLTGISKLYEAATLPDHLILGVIQGSLVLYLFIKYGEKLIDWFIGLNKNKALLVSFGIAASIYLITFIVTEIQLTYDLPAIMVKYKVIPSQRLTNGATVFGTGFLLSALLSLNTKRFNQLNTKLNVALWKRVLFTLIGLIVIVILFIVVRQALVNLLSIYLYQGIINFAAAFSTGIWMYSILPEFLNRNQTNSNKIV